jgi:hypothetical protein
MDTIVVTQISEANGASRYMTRTSTQEFNLLVRHSKEKAVGSATPLDRHNMELSVRTFPTADLPLGKTETAYIVARSDPNSDGTESQTVLEALCDIAVTYKSELVGWQTTF